MRRTSMPGRKFGRLTVIGEHHRDTNGAFYWLCRCDCGNVLVANGGNLRRGKTKSCGCLKREASKEVGINNAIDITGERFGRLVAVEVDHSGPGGRYWLCQCDCGNTAVALCADLRSGTTKSCGCLAAECSPPDTTTHGMSKTKLYGVWVAMRQRCENPNDRNYARYGGRGIAVCDEWKSFEPFREWALANGYIEGKTDIDREDNDKGYSPENCRFISHKDNLRNTHRKLHDVINGEDITLSEAAEKYGISYRRIYQSYKRGKRGDALIG